MPHDATGKPLAVGDRVRLPVLPGQRGAYVGVVAAITPGATACELAVDYPLPTRGHFTASEVEKLEPEPAGFTHPGWKADAVGEAANRPAGW
jgi:hypothetical protein